MRSFFSLVILSIVISGYVFFFVPHAEAAITQCSMEGFAWTGYDTNGNGTPDEGVGWISFSSNNESSPSANYGVNVETDGDMVGYAWSSNIGWIRFGGFAGFPTGNGTVPVNARSVQAWPPTPADVIRDFEGWARACAVFAPGPNGISECGGGDDVLRQPYELGGWDGWISLRGQNSGNGAWYGVWYDNTVAKEWFEGWAYGGAINIGWVRFNSQTPGPGQSVPSYWVSLPNANSQCLNVDFVYDLNVNDQFYTYNNGDPLTFNVDTDAIIDTTENPNGESVRLTSVDEIDIPSGMNITNIQIPAGGCVPTVGNPCTRGIRVSFDISGYPIVPGTFENVIFEAHSISNQSGITDSDQFTIRVIFPAAPPPDTACTATPAVAFVNQPVTWDAPDPQNAGITNPIYRWFEPTDPGDPNPPPPPPAVPPYDTEIVAGSGQESFQEIFDTSGTYYRYAKICQFNSGFPPILCDVVDEDSVCSVTIILNPEFEPF